jgi:hypothetical protein
MVDWFGPSDIDWLGGRDAEEEAEEVEAEVAEEETQEESI